MLAKKSGRPVKMVMTREEVFRASGPTSGSMSKVKIGAKKDGTIVAGQGTYWLQAGAFPGSPIRGAAGCAFGPYDIPNAHYLGLRRRLQPLEGRGLPRARRADRRLCRRVRAR